jgi:hypothetical protein
MSIDDPGCNMDVASRIEVLLNGTARSDVVSYDVPARTLRRYTRPGDIEILHGDVAVRWKSDEA